MNTNNRTRNKPTDAERLRRNRQRRMLYAAQKAAIREKRQLATFVKKKAVADGQLRRYHINKTSFNNRRLQRRIDQRTARTAVLAARRHRWEADLFSVQQGDDIADLHDAIQRRKEVLSAAREAAGVNIK
ncbi:unnamed protein product, partial [Pylaiella littoralis]